MGAGQFNRLDRDGWDDSGPSGDFLEGSLRLIEGPTPDQSFLVEFAVDGSGSYVAAIRHKDGDLEFYDSTVGSWVKLNNLALGGLVSEMRDTIVGVNGQQTYTCSAYVSGAGALNVYVGGVRINPDHVTETSDTSFTIDTAGYTFVGGEDIAVEVVKGAAYASANPIVEVSASDTTPGRLYDKVITDTFLVRSISSPSGDEDLLIAIASQSVGEVLAYGAAGAPTVVPAGTTGQVLMATTGSAPSFADLPGTVKASAVDTSPDELDGKLNEGSGGFVALSKGTDEIEFDLADQAEGQIIAFGAGGVPEVVAAGTDGQVLTAQASGAPAFEDLPASSELKGLCKLRMTVASGATAGTTYWANFNLVTGAWTVDGSGLTTVTEFTRDIIPPSTTGTEELCSVVTQANWGGRTYNPQLNGWAIAMVVLNSTTVQMQMTYIDTGLTSPYHATGACLVMQV